MQYQLERPNQDAPRNDPHGPRMDQRVGGERRQPFEGGGGIPPLLHAREVIALQREVRQRMGDHEREEQAQRTVL